MNKINPQPTELTLRQWWDEVGTENVKLVADSLGSSMKYFKFLRYRAKRPGYNRALAIIQAANRFTPGFAPNLTLMMEPIPSRQPNPEHTLVLQPSKAFLKAQKLRTETLAA